METKLKKTMTTAKKFVAVTLLLSLFLFSSVYALPQAQQNPKWNVGLSPNIKTYFTETTWINTSQPIVVSSLWRDNWLNYTVSALGTQQICYGDRPIKVVLDGVERSEGDGWSYADGTVTVTGATSNVSLYWGPSATTLTLLIQALPLLLLAGMVLLAVAMIKKFNLYLLIGLVLLIILFATVMNMIGGLT